MEFSEEVARAIQSKVAVIGMLNGQIEDLEKRLQGRVGKCREYDLLTGVPGIGQTLATDILLEVGTIERFGGVGQLASYARCVDRVHGSNGKKKGERRREGQERQQIPCLGVHRSGPLRAALLSRGQAFLRTQEIQDEHRGRDQGAGAQTSASVLPHAEGGKTL